MLDLEADPAPLRGGELLAGEGEFLAETDAQQVEVLHDLPGAQAGIDPRGLRGRGERPAVRGVS